jgi:hypothetical protein
MLDPRRAGGGSTALRIAALLALFVGALLRFYPVHVPYVGLENQEGYVRAAVVAFMAEHWESPFKVHGTALFLVLRGLLTAWYGVGHAAGLYEQRTDLLAAYVVDPSPFVVAGRLLTVAAALWTIVVVGRLGRELFGPRAAVAGMLFLAVAFAHVRESHNVSPDIPSALLALLAVVASIRVWQRPDVWTAALAGLSGGLALAFKPSVFPIAAPVAIGAWGPPGGTRRSRAMRLAVAGGIAIVTIVALAPGRFWTLLTTARLMGGQTLVTFTTDVPALPIPTYLQIGLGWPMVILAGIGVVASGVRRGGMGSLLPATFGILYAAVLLSAGFRFVRYLAILAPFVALYAGFGAAVVGSWTGRRRAGWVTAALAVAVACEPMLAGARHAAALARPDTRVLAGRWLEEHAGPGTPIAVPDVLACSHPSLPADNALLLSQFRPAGRHLGAYGLGVRGRVHPVPRITFLGKVRRQWKPSPGFAVTASHPVVFPSLDTPPEALAMLRDAGAREVARFAGLEAPVPDDVVFDRIDADYVPLRGAQYVEHPGPSLTIWEVPVPAVEAP